MYYISATELTNIIPVLPLDTVRMIQSYLIQKIPRYDRRYMMLDKHFYDYNYLNCKREMFWNDGTFRGWLISFMRQPQLMLIVNILPRLFMYYSFQNIDTKKQGDYQFCLKYQCEDAPWSYLNFGPTTQPINT
jgi:hypothetical protein